MDEMVAWLRGVLDDTEAAAAATRRRVWESDERITVTGDVAGVWILGDDGDPVAIAQDATAEDGDSIDPRTIASHIARHDPAAVLADVAAKRAILDAYTTRAQLVARAGAASARANQPLEYVVRTLASAYRHRRGWKREWEA